MPRIAIIKPACSALLIPFSISAVPQKRRAPTPRPATDDFSWLRRH